jgi:hypothetical protein
MLFGIGVLVPDCTSTHSQKKRQRANPSNKHAQNYNTFTRRQTLNFQHWDFFFFLVFMIGLYSIHRLAKVREVGEVEEKIVIHELVSEIRRPLSNLSTVGGLWQMIVFPMSLLRNVPGMDHFRGQKTKG